MRPTFSEVLVDLNVLLQEARGIGAASLHMKVRHKIRYAKSYMSYALRGSSRYRPLLFLSLGGVLVAGALLAKFGKNVETGAALLVVASAGLYLVLLSYVPAGDGNVLTSHTLVLHSRSTHKENPNSFSAFMPICQDVPTCIPTVTILRTARIANEMNARAMRGDHHCLPVVTVAVVYSLLVAIVLCYMNSSNDVNQVLPCCYGVFLDKKILSISATNTPYQYFLHNAFYRCW